MNKKVLGGLAAMVVLAFVAVFLWWSLSTRSLDNPRSLVPSNIDVYAEAESLISLEAGLKEISGSMEIPVSLTELARHLPGLMGQALASPERTGIDVARPFGYALKLSIGGVPRGIAYVPVKDISALAAHLKIGASEMKQKAVAIEGGFVAYKKGYLLFSDAAASIDDLLALKEKGITVSDALPGTLARVFVMRPLLESAMGLIAQMPPDAPEATRYTALFAGKILKSLNGIEIASRWTAEGLRLKIIFQVKPKNEVLATLTATSGSLPFIEALPTAGLIGGMHLEPQKAAAFSQKLLENLLPLIPDTATAELFKIGMGEITPEAATAILSWNTYNPSLMKSVTLQRMPSGHEEEFVTKISLLREQSALLWEKMMRESGDTLSHIEHRNLASSQYKGIKIETVEIKTTLGLHPPARADAEMLKMYDGLNHQRSIQRFARVPGLMPSTGTQERPKENSPADLLVTAAGEDEAIIKSQIDRLLSRGESDSMSAVTLRAIDNPVIARVAKLLRPDIFGYAIIDPFYLTGTSTAPANAFGISGSIEGDNLVVDLVLPKEHLKGLPGKLMGQAAGMGQLPMGAIPEQR